MKFNIWPLAAAAAVVVAANAAWIYFAQDPDSAVSDAPVSKSRDTRASNQFIVQRAQDPVDPVRPEWMDPFESQLTAATFPLVDGVGAAVVVAENRVALVNLWARWCGPCVREMPSLIALAKELKPYGVDLYAAATMDGPPTEVAAFVADKGWSQDLAFVYSGEDDIVRQIGARGLPATVIFDHKGVGVAQHFSPADWESEEVVAYLKALASQI